MKEKIEQFAKGNFEYELPTILLSEEKLDITIEIGNTYEGSFTITNSEKSQIKGVVYTNNAIICFQNNQFVGESAVITYKVDATKIDVVQEVIGEIQIVTDCGEAFLPVCIHIEAPFLTTSFGAIKEIEAFAKVAKNDWLEAKKLFKSELFQRTLHYYESRYDSLYRALRKSSSTSQALDEFLIASKQKKKVTYRVDKTRMSLEVRESNLLDKIVIKKEGWGYGALKVSTDVSFIALDRKMIWNEEFSEDTFELGVIIKADQLFHGSHQGHIYLQSVNQEITIPVSVTCNTMLSNHSKKLEKKQWEVKLVDSYFNFQFHNITKEQYTKEALESLLAIDTLDKESVMQLLYRLYIYLMAGKETVVREELDRLLEKPEVFMQESSMQESPVAYAVALYLDTLTKDGKTTMGKALEVAREYYSKDQGNWIYLWLQLYLDKRYEVDKKKKYLDLKRQFVESRTITPILYYEAVRVLQELPSLLKELSGFELQLMCFAIKHKVLTKEVAMQFSYLANREKRFDPLLLQLLKKVYHMFELKEALQAICSMLIRNGKKETKYFYWYQQAIAIELRIAELPEYYMYSIDESTFEEIDPAVLTYFGYHLKLPDKLKAYLFANLIYHKEKMETVYTSYQDKIYEFALAQLRAVNMSNHLVSIYQDVFFGESMDGEVASYLPEIIFKHELRCENASIKSVVVIHKECKEEVVTTVTDGSAVIDLYTKEYEIYFTDANGNRYNASIDYTITPLFERKDTLLACYPSCKEHKKLILYLLSMEQEYKLEKTLLAELCKEALGVSDLEQNYRAQLILRLVKEGEVTIDRVFIERYVLPLQIEQLTIENRVQILEFLLMKKQYQEVMPYLEEYGFDVLDLKKLYSFCKWAVNEFKEAKVLVTRMCYHIYKRGTFNASVLQYLVKHYEGTTLSLLEIWQDAREMELDTLDLEERLLGQMLFTETYIWNGKEVFLKYYRTGFYKTLITAYLSFCSYKYLVKNRVMEAEFFEIIRKEQGLLENEVCMLALLKYYSKKMVWNESEQHFIRTQVKKFEAEDKLLPFFEQFKQFSEIPKRMQDKYYVEYRANPKNEVRIHYSYKEAQREEEYQVEEMQPVCYGIFVKEFVLFEGDTLFYYISEKQEDKKTVTEVMELTCTTKGVVSKALKYEQLNQMVKLKQTKEEEAFIEALKTYCKTEYVISQLFRMI